jgi:alkaline phosphatase D
VLAQQVMMAMVELRFSERLGFSMDQWPGYAHERMELVRFMADRKVPNPVVLTGDIHSNWANDLRVDDRGTSHPLWRASLSARASPAAATGKQVLDGLDKFQEANPCVRFHNQERATSVAPSRRRSWTSDYVVCEEVLKPEGKIVTRASFVVEAGNPGAKKA